LLSKARKPSIENVAGSVAIACTRLIVEICEDEQCVATAELPKLVDQIIARNPLPFAIFEGCPNCALDSGVLVRANG
jgi:hypothetical protein